MPAMSIMIIHQDLQTGDWRRVMREAVREPAELFRLLALDQTTLPGTQAAAGNFPLLVTRPFIRRMSRGDPQDPLLLQVLPRAEELLPTSGYLPDPLGEARQNPLPGLIHKYRDRVLLILTEACPVHCRYCFRRHFDYRGNRPPQWQQTALEYIRERPQLREVIFSGGDPLMLGDAQLSAMAKQLAAIPHLRRLRIHTRMPVLVPSRVTGQLLSWLHESPLAPVIVVHINHPNEIDGEVSSALLRLRRQNIPLLNQSVLLKGINDDAEILRKLSERLFGAGVLPYYLHLPDPVEGTGAFRVSERRGRRLLAELAASISGYLVPRLVREMPGMPAKIVRPPLF